MGASRLKKLIRKLGPAARAKAVALPHRRTAPIPAPVNSLQSLLRAAGFAARKHHGQTRADDSTPYFAHVARVTLILAHVFGVHDEEILTAAFLHDTLEDTATDFDEIAHAFGTRVAEYVVQLTKNVMLPKTEREEDYVARLSRAPEAVMIAKMADLFDNLSDRINSPKLRKTASSAERLLAVFDRRLSTETGRGAHRALRALLDEVKEARLAMDVPVANGKVVMRRRPRRAGG